MADEILFDEGSEFDDRILVAVANLGSAGPLIPIGRGASKRSHVVDLAQFAAWATSIGWKMPEEMKRIAARHSPHAPAAKANHEQWAGYQTWTLIEAACLLADIEPVPSSKFDKDRRTGGLPAQIYSDLKDAIDLKQIEWIESRDPYIEGRRVKPSDCVTWAAGRCYSIHPSLAHLKRRDPNETPEQRRSRLSRRVDEERERKNRAFLKTVAAEEGISETRLKQILNREEDLPPPTGKTTSKTRNRM